MRTKNVASKDRTHHVGPALGGRDMFDGRNEKGDCGLQGGMLVATGHAIDSFWLVDSSKVEVPIVALDAHLGEVDEAFDAIFDLDEDTEVGTVNHGSLKDLAQEVAADPALTAGSGTGVDRDRRRDAAC